MATTYKTPGVYVEEIVKFPPSVAQVETAIPAFIGYTEKGYAKMCWKIGTPPSVVSGCCRQCLKHFYDIGDTSLTEYCKFVKADKEIDSAYTDSAAPYVYGEMFRSSLDDAARRVGITLNHRQIAAAQIPNTEKVTIYYIINLQFIY